MREPVTFSQEVFDAICERIAEGESLRKICESEGMPHKSNVLRWLEDENNVLLRDQYARAREQQADKLFDETIEIADNKGTEKGQVARDRLRVDVRKWAAGKLRPKKYGDKHIIGGDPDNPLTVNVDPSQKLAEFLANKSR